MVVELEMPRIDLDSRCHVCLQQTNISVLRILGIANSFRANNRHCMSKLLNSPLRAP